jgi:cell division protein ZapA (FtsZ GTPase activity inhibitor)
MRIFEMIDLEKVTEELKQEIKELKERYDSLIELAISNMLKIEALIELQVENGIIKKDELMDKVKGLDREMKGKREP